MEKIIISGFGGQGVLSLGQFISYSAMNCNLNTSWLPSYGPEMRGGTANCSVVVSDKEIASPVIDAPNVLVCLNEPSLTKFENSLIPGGTLLVNSSIVKKETLRKDVKVLKVPVDEIAEKINNKGGNIIMLGVLLNVLKGLTVEAAREAIKKVFASKPKLIDINLKCLDEGLNLKF